jgi:hypothetical protein
MISILATFLVLRGTSPPTIVTVILLGLSTYQLAAGKLLNMRWGIWTTRAQRPRLYWSVVAIEVAIALFGLYACFT